MRGRRPALAAVACAVAVAVSGCTQHPSLATASESQASLDRMIVVADAAMTASGFGSWSYGSGVAFSGGAQESFADTADCSATQLGAPVQTVGQRPTLTLHVAGNSGLSADAGRRVESRIGAAWRKLGLEVAPERPGRGQIPLVGSDKQVDAVWTSATATLTLSGLCAKQAPAG
ncbi:hypothetical protein [Gryllotalpicola ginsengisoli]|uniref:hypothetical protein n=1 Tax=Gryllotalpicola ginsengisoli TaxID=444608 RepID=UPI0003B361DB|nr:hypothetical protein [Gryllotalpicola ginsengisoli]